MSRVLIIDDEPTVCWALEKYFKSRGHQASSVASAEEGIARIAEQTPALVLLDVRLPGMNGLEALALIRQAPAPPPVVVITAHGTMETAVEAMRRGAFDYLLKPFDLAQIDEVLQRALANLAPAAEVPAAPSGVLQMVGSSALMQAVYKQIGMVAASDANVLITGESGTGKELVARSIHLASARSEGPFEPLVCASLPESLLESELYGYEPGAFTGATHRRIGRLERASGGTLFLDEISEIPLAIQVKLLRFLEERVVERLGGTERVPVDIRLLAAANRPLGELVRLGLFREDLLYRLQVVTIELPPLRQRPEDILELVGAFLAGASISQEALAALHGYYWPGNVRELRHAVEHAVVMARDATITPAHLPPYLAQDRPVAREDELRAAVRSQVESHAADGELYARLLAEWEKALLGPVLERTGGNQLKAAELLGMSRGTLRKKLRQHGLSPGDGDQGEGEAHTSS